jgi:hypothetical protein
VNVTVAFGQREAFGEGTRKRVLVIMDKEVLVQFAGTDNYDKTGNLIATLKKPKSEEMYRINDSIPPELRRFNIVYHKDYVRDGFDRLALVVNCSDIKTMIDYALTRALLEEKIK